MEVIILSFGQIVSAAQHGSDLGTGGIHFIRRNGADHDLIDLGKLGDQQRVGRQIFRLFRIVCHTFAGVNAARSGGGGAFGVGGGPRLQAGNALADRCPRGNDHVILIHAHHVGALLFQHADDLEVHILDPDGAVHRRTAAEDFLHDGLTDHAHTFPPVDFPLSETSAFADLPIPDPEIIIIGPDDLPGSPVLISENELKTGGIDNGRDKGDIGTFLPDRIAVFRLQGHGRTLFPFSAGNPGSAGHDDKRIDAHAFHILFHGGIGALSDLHHSDHGADPDHDPQHGQQGTGRVPAQGSNGTGNRSGYGHNALSCSP